MLWLLLAAFAGTCAAWLLAAFVPAFEGWRHLANLGAQFTVYLIIIIILLQGFRVFTRRRAR